MTSINESLKKVLPKKLVQGIGKTRDWFDRLPEIPGAYLHPWRRNTIRQLIGLKDSHKGQRCFIIGNGPSLRNTDLSKLRNEFTIGMNRFYLAYPDLGFQTTYYLSINNLVIEQCATDIQALKIPRFIAWRSHKYLQPDQNLFFLYTSYTGMKFARNISSRLWEGATVTYTALQVAYYLGFQTVILIGVDHSFSTQGKPNTTVISQGDDPNHFSPAYFGKGFRWQLPDLQTSEISYTLARETYKKAGRQVLDATVDGKLTVFPKIKYEGLF
jgi:hypothetical protein